MLRFQPAKTRDEPIEVLCLGAHGDDIEIGCGGAIIRLAEEHPSLSVTWIVLSSGGDRKEEILASARAFLDKARSTRILIETFRDGFFPSLAGPIKEYFERRKLDVSPDLIFTHARDDAHQDHRLVSELTWNTWRDHAILEYEIPKYDGDLGRPNLYVSLDEALARQKASLIRAHFASQAKRAWFTEDVFLAIMRLRGVESRSSGGFAEAFHGRKLVV